jgi:hypothetical protein
LTLSICGVGFQHRTHGEEEHRQNSVCIAFFNLNKATHKDEYPMPIADMLINNTSRHRVISFLDGNDGYNQIFMAKEDISKTYFIVLVLLVYLNGML